jgi:uncharacterized protein YjbI with pentapeptide repeats
MFGARRWLATAAVGALAVTCAGAGSALVADPAGARPNKCVLVANPTKEHHTDCPNEDLVEAPWAHENLNWANFAGSNMEGAHLRGAKLEWANLTKVNLTNGHVQEADLDHADLTGATLNSKPVDLSGPNLDMYDSTLRDATLNGAMIDGGNWARVDATGAKFRDAIIIPYMSKAKMIRTDLTGASVFAVTWVEADFSGAIKCHTFFANKGVDNSDCPKSPSP